MDWILPKEREKKKPARKPGSKKAGFSRAFVS